MPNVTIHPRWELNFSAGKSLDASALLALLVGVADAGSIAQAAKQVGLSYRYAWGLLREAELLFGEALLETGRGRGTRLTLLAQKMVWADRRIRARLAPTLASLAAELESELGKVATERFGKLRIDASHGFAVAALTEHLALAGLPVELRYRNSTDAVAALARHECDLAGFHVPIGAHEPAAVAAYTRWLDPAQHCLLQLGVRQQGLFVAPGNPLRLRTLADLARPQVRFVNRQAGSGTRMLLELLLQGAGVAAHDIQGYNNTEFTDAAVAAYIASGMADVGVGVRTAAAQFGLDFVPLVRERYFFALPIGALDEPLMRHVVAVVQSGALRRAVDTLAGYNAFDTGTILTLEQAFGLS